MPSGNARFAIETARIAASDPAGRRTAADDL